MTQPAPPASMDEVRAIQFRGREIMVKFPTDGQLIVWQRTVRNLQSTDTNSWTGEDALRAGERAAKIIDSVIVNRADRDWLDDETLDKGLGLIDRAEIITLTIKAFGGGEEKTPAKKATPVKRARRKAS